MKANYDRQTLLWLVRLFTMNRAKQGATPERVVDWVLADLEDEDDRDGMSVGQMYRIRAIIEADRPAAVRYAARLLGRQERRRQQRCQRS